MKRPGVDPATSESRRESSTLTTASSGQIKKGTDGKMADPRLLLSWRWRWVYNWRTEATNGEGGEPALVHGCV